ncbi:hypothetical protein OF829_15555 [Sphingomonas sp. LB-2]|uniref:hypothetical protein n=1 Tax=Sphingomonas caeni TaxID=2984949 RepID=UPI002231D094|nr:hypothetical protein [Sphingomonas caeni]MCW3848651.1 hypothetical protein [Sphingomonas caeni]
MRKAAIFVEGQTELIFVRRLIEEMAGAHNVVFHEEKYHAKTYQTLSAVTPAGEAFFILLVNCCADNAVLSAILDRHPGLSNANYEIIIGLRDLYPLSHADLPVLSQSINSQLPAAGTIVSVIIAVAEVEAWFVQENLHFPIIDAAITRDSIQTAFNYDIDNDLAENLSNPALSLDSFYKIANKRYTKKRARISRTVGALDIDHLYLDRRVMLPSFDSFALELENFFNF